MSSIDSYIATTSIYVLNLSIYIAKVFATACLISLTVCVCVHPDLGWIIGNRDRDRERKREGLIKEQGGVDEVAQ